jgi:PTH1 family peptidyl-tRNA hydrolase
MIVGLGNPGRQYEETRHNIGFKVVDLYGASKGVVIDRPKEQALVGEYQHANGKVLLVKPQTYMNLSGQAVGNLARWYKISLEDIMVVYDELDLPVGQLRIRPSGSAGGHNGMKSIIAHLGTEAFPRIRVGISRPPMGVAVADYVLSTFTPAERDAMVSVMERGVQAITTWMDKGLTATMNLYSK